MSTMPLSLSNIVSISVSVSAQPALSPAYNQGLIVGPSPVIPNATRVMQFSSLAGILAAGYTALEPEYLAAQAVFAQSPAPSYVWLGLQDTTAVSTLVIDAPGTGYVVGDVLTIASGPAHGGTAQVTAIGTGGDITALSVDAQGTGYTAAAGLLTTGGTGTGATVTITAIGESLLQAVTACRSATSDWYAVYCCGASHTDVEAIAPFIEAAAPVSTFFFNNYDTTVPAGTAGNVFLTLQAEKFTRTIGVYSTTQNSVFPLNIYAGAALMGVATGLSTGLPGSYYTLMFKQLAGIAPEPLSQTQFTNCLAANANVYVSQGFNSAFQIFQPGVMSSGQYYDQTYNRDLLVTNLQYEIVDELISVPEIPQTNAGQQRLLQAATLALATSAATGYISPGTWTGATILAVTNGTALTNGYLAQSAGYVTQSPAARAARQAMPIAITYIEAGAIQSVAVSVAVQL
jgi:hypothetical protein